MLAALTLWFTWSITSTNVHPTRGIISRLAQSTNRGDLQADLHGFGRQKNCRHLEQRRQARLAYQPEMYQRLIDLAPRRNNALEPCMGTIAEMMEGNVYDAFDQCSRQGKIADIHLRNVVGKVPHYRATFIVKAMWT